MLVPRTASQARNRYFFKTNINNQIQAQVHPIVAIQFSANKHNKVINADADRFIL